MATVRCDWCWQLVTVMASGDRFVAACRCVSFTKRHSSDAVGRWKKWARKQDARRRMT